jgi:pimeloyl-ACP methyl ester carboxylesterase
MTSPVPGWHGGTLARHGRGWQSPTRLPIGSGSWQETGGRLAAGIAKAGEHMRHFTSGGLDLAYIDLPPTGDVAAGTILLIHGFASNHAVNWVNTQWTRTLTHVGYRVIALDNRGHGRSDKPRDPAAYDTNLMAGDAVALLDHLHIERADVMGYSMGARITAHVALNAPGRVRSALLGGLGIHLVRGVGLPIGIAEAMEAPSLDMLTDPMQRMFRAFAEQTGSDLLALAACIRGSRQVLSEAQVAQIRCPVLVSVGTRDPIAGSAQELAALIPGARALDIPDRDHNLAVGDKTHKQGVLAFLAERP